MACEYICPGGFTLYRYSVLHAAIDDPSEITGGVWYRVPEVLSWELEADVEDPVEFRTADTSGLKVSACPGSTSFSVTVTTKLCKDMAATPSRWLYDFIMNPANAVGGGGVQADTGWYLGANTIENRWWFLAFDANAAASAGLPTAPPTPTNRGIYILGRPTPPGFGGDNDEDDPAEAEFTISIAQGPYFPNLTNAVG